jgi:hypothetical protein
LYLFWWLMVPDDKKKMVNDYLSIYIL